MPQNLWGKLKKSVFLCRKPCFGPKTLNTLSEFPMDIRFEVADNIDHDFINSLYYTSSS